MVFRIAEIRINNLNAVYVHSRGCDLEEGDVKIIINDQY
jgi:hypothetical protein